MVARPTQSGSQAWTHRAWTSLLRRLILPIGDLAFRQVLLKRLTFLEQAQWWDVGAVERYRMRALEELMALSYKEVPFYQELLDLVGVSPSSIKGVEDLRRIPPVTKEMLRRRYPAGTTRRTGRRLYETCSSGSTGTNFRVVEDVQTASLHRASFMLALGWSGWQVGEPHLQTGMTLARSFEKRLKDLLLRCHYVSAFDLSDEHLDAVLERMERYGIQYVWGYPGSLYWLAQRATQRGWNRPLRSLSTWGDMLHAHYRRAIEAAFQARVFDTYGCGEGIQVAAQCGADSSYHVHSLDVIVEYVDDEGRPVPPGVPGNILLTRLYAGPMPLIRYSVGDVAVSGGGSQCVCGRGFSVMESIQGREGDIIVTPSGNRLIVHFFTGVLEHFHEVENFQIVQEDRASLVVRVVPANGFSAETGAAISRALREAGAQDMQIQVEPVPEIPLPNSGKHRFVLSKYESGTPTPNGMNPLKAGCSGSGSTVPRTSDHDAASERFEGGHER